MSEFNNDVSNDRFYEADEAEPEQSTDDCDDYLEGQGYDRD